ncbi:MAG: AAA family ATPase [Lachnospiraceae bacterium]|nr:AAA family ATPase [Lachnospiraceae bacterium]
MGEIIAIANQKGGCAKTTTCISLGVGLARQGAKVLLIDFDPQGNTTQSLGFNPDSLDLTVSDVLQKMIERDYSLESGYGILHSRENVDLLPANIELATMEIRLQAVYIGREKLLANYMQIVKNLYDYILIDCKPSLDTVTLNALVAGDTVLIPVQAQYYSVKGLEQLLNTISMVVTEGLNPRLTVKGILLTLANPKTNNFKEIKKVVENAYGQNIRIFDTYIPRAVTAEEAPASGTSIYLYDKAGKVAKAYEAFTEEFLMEGGVLNG